MGVGPRPPPNAKTDRSLTDIPIRNAKATDKPYKFSDGGGLYVEIMPHGSKRWRMKVRQANGKESIFSFGAYPGVPLVDAPLLLDVLRPVEKRGAVDMAARLGRILMRLMMLVFVRTSEMIETPWAEIDLENETSVIPWQRMKMGERRSTRASSTIMSICRVRAGYCCGICIT